MRNLIFLLCCFLCFIGSSYAQSNLGKVWVNGAGGIIRGTRFNADNSIKQFVVKVTDSIIFDNGKSNICDTNGKLILLCNGHNLYDSSLNLLENGDSLTFAAHYTHDFYGGYCALEQWSLILPFSNNQYRVINLAESDSEFASQNTSWFFPPDFLLYHDVDMNANGGAGKVINKKQILDTGRFAFNGMQACRHANGKDWWLVKQCFDSLAFYTYLLTDTGIIKYGLQSFTNIPLIYAMHEGQIMFNNAGNKMVSVSACATCSKHLFLFDFNRCNGILSNPIFPNNPNLQPVANGGDWCNSGACFSPNDSFVYLAQCNHIAQYDIYALDSASAWTNIAGLDTTLNEFTSYGNIFPGPDGKIYISNWNYTSNQMSVINKPNKKGLASEFCPRCLRFDTVYNYPGIGGPPNMPNYAMGADSSSCWPLSNVQYSINPNREQLKVYPNPACSNVIIDVGELTKNNICIINTAGQVLYNQIPKTVKTTIDVSQWASGVYFVRYGSKVKRLVVG
jgi:hypothetical protein